MKPFLPRRVSGGCLRSVWGTVVSFLVLVICAQAVSPFEEGNMHFKEGKYSEAEQAYNRSLATDGDTPSTRYNLGKVREALGDPGGAMLEWERALRLDPQHPQSLKSLLASRTAVNSRPDTTGWWLSVQPASSLGKEHWILAAGFWLTLAGLCLAASRKHLAEASSVMISGLLCLCFGFVWWRHSVAEADMALVKERSVVFRAAPADPARALEALNAGTRLQLLDESGGWSRCRLSEGLVGWVPSTSIERISASK